jgi:DNA (cytosine-5)-methyltransferase 1
MDALKHVDLCSGIGGFALGFEWAELSSPVLFCDIEPWSRKVLAKHWPDVPIATDVKELASDPDGNVPDCDIITAGYPCQPFSLAGKRGGSEDDRHIWPHILQIVASKRPAWCVFENVYGHLTLGLDQVLSDLEVEGYATRPFIVPACGVDAPHKRDRIWIIAKNMADTNNSGREEQRWPKPAQPKHQAPQCGSGWLPEPAVGRVANGIPRRVDRLRGLGNAIVPQIAMRIGQTIRSEA